MKNYLSIYFIISFLSLYGQGDISYGCGEASEYFKKNRYVKQSDTLKSIKLRNLDNQKIIFKKGNLEFRFDKDLVVEMINKKIEVSQPMFKTTEVPFQKFFDSIEMKYVTELRKIVSYLQISDSIELTQIDCPQNDEENNIVKLTSCYLLYDLCCELIDSGNFVLLKEDVLQTLVIKGPKLTKMEVSNSGTVYERLDATYTLPAPDRQVVWTCFAPIR